MKKQVYVIDLDKTLLDGPCYAESEPIPGRVEVVNRLYDEGHTIILYTARGATSGGNWFRVTYDTLIKYGVKFTELRMGKFHYDVWVDDKAINDKDFFK